MGRPGPALTPEIHGRIIESIRAGGFPHVAAAAAGVPAPVFRKWLDEGQRPGASDLYRRFARAVREAEAQARLEAELEVRKKDPRFWLRYGPGRETDRSRGWSAPGKPAAPGRTKRPVSTASEVTRIWRLIFATLQAHPEARAAVAQALENADAPATALPERGSDAV